VKTYFSIQIIVFSKIRLLLLLLSSIYVMQEKMKEKKNQKLKEKGLLMRSRHEEPLVSCVCNHLKDWGN